MPEKVISRFQRFTSVVKDAIFLATMIVALSTAVGSFAVTMVWPFFIEQLKTDLNVATKDDLAAFEQKLNRIAGEDRIIRMPVGHSYVSEPVTKGDPIDVTLVMNRTEKGEPCIYVSGMPLYTDDRGVPFSGAPIAPIKQLGQLTERLPLRLDPPAALNPGRVGLTISMKFSCPFGPDGAAVEVYETTDAIFFAMDPAD